ncbi:hypothetical protein [Allohahella marinimesophila]|uniref:hypothetical protein n=1 Tax=Allohahella marinimesophila TaxID=1054972 RepID=UPI0031E430F8
MYQISFGLTNRLANWRRDFYALQAQNALTAVNRFQLDHGFALVSNSDEQASIGRQLEAALLDHERVRQRGRARCAGDGLKWLSLHSAVGAVDRQTLRL